MICEYTCVVCMHSFFFSFFFWIEEYLGVLFSLLWVEYNATVDDSSVWFCEASSVNIQRVNFHCYSCPLPPDFISQTKSGFCSFWCLLNLQKKKKKNPTVSACAVSIRNTWMKSTLKINILYHHHHRFDFVSDENWFIVLLWNLTARPVSVHHKQEIAQHSKGQKRMERVGPRDHQ